jgi:adhesin/invasin
MEYQDDKKSMRVTFFKFGNLIPTLSVVLSFALAGCQTPDSNQLSSLTGLTSSSTPIPADNVGSGKVLLISGGNNQTIDQNSPAPNSLDVIALDNLGAPIPNLTIGYMITSGGGSLTGGGITAVTTTNDNGIASMGYSSGSSIGQTTIIATSSAGSTSFTITVGLSTNSAAGGALLLATNGNNQLVAKNATASRSLEVLALNNLGNAIPSLPVTFKILTTGAGTLTGGSNTASIATDGNGRASIAFNAGTQTGSVSIIATSSAGSAVFNLTVNDSGTLSSLTIASGNGQSIAPNAAASLPLEVIATGADGSPISGIVVSFSVSTQNGGTVSNATVTTGANGRASTNFTSGTATGTINVLAASNLGSTTFSISVNQPGTTGATSAMLLASSGNNQTIQPSATAPKSLEVTALNSLGVPMPGVAVKFEVITSGAGNVTGGTTIANVITNANGRASTNFTASAQSGAVSVIATSTAGSAVFTVTVNQPGATSTSSGSTLLITSGNNQSLNPSTLAPKNLEVMAVNSLGIPMAGIPVSFEVVTTGGGTLTSGGSSETMNTAANGRASISFTSGTQTGSISVIATSSAGNAVFTLNVGASTNSVAAGSMLLVTNGNGQAVLQGTTATKNLEVMAVNNLGVPMAGIPITFEILTASAGTLTGSATTATSTTGANGRASVSYTASNTLGPVTVIATSTAGSAVFNLVINATGTGSSLTISGGNGQTLAPNSASTTPLEVFVSNTSGAAVSGVSVTFTVTTTNGGLVSNGTTAITTTTNANGKASTTFQSGSATGNIAVLASSSAGSATFNVNVTNPGSNQNANATLLVSNGNNQSFEQGTAAPKSLEVMAIDSLGNPISGLQVGYTLLTSGAGTLTGGAATASATTGANGRASIGFTASSQTGAVSIVATSTAGSAVFNLNVNPTGTGTILSISSGNHQTVAPNGTANVPFEVIATNASGNPVANVPVTFTITTLNSGNVTGGSSSVSQHQRKRQGKHHLHCGIKSWKRIRSCFSNFGKCALQCECPECRIQQLFCFHGFGDQRS